MGRGRSAGKSQVCTREDVSLVWAQKLNCGRSAAEARTVRRLIKVIPETMLVSGCVELLTADGPPLGRGRSARA